MLGHGTKQSCLAAVQKCESVMDCFFFYTVDIKGDVNFSLLSQKS